MEEEIKHIIREADIITNSYYLSGEVTQIGALSSWLNDRDLPMLTIRKCSVQALDTKSPLSSFEHNKVTLNKQEIIAIRLGEDSKLGAHQMMINRLKLVVYTDRYIVQGLFHVPPNTPEEAAFIATAGRFSICTRVFIHALEPTNVRIFKSAPLLFLNKNHIRFFHEARS